jgi:Zn-dependent protease with chaperone function
MTGWVQGPAAADAALLATLLVLLSGPVPRVLQRWSWPRSSPRSGLLLWVAVSWAWALSLAGLVLAVALAPLGRPLLPALVAAVQSAVPWALQPAVAPAVQSAAALPASALVGAGAAAVAFLALPAVAAASWARDARRGGRHASRLAVLGAADVDGDLLVLPSGAPLALTLPGWRRGRVVVTRACLEQLAPLERDAVVAHERAHAAGAHHVVRAWFAAWRRLAPLPGPRAAEAAVAVLLEVIADRAAARVAGPAATASALHRRCAPPTGGWRPQPATLVRLRTLARSGTAVPPLVRVSMPSLAAVLLVVPGLVLGRA